MTRGGPCSFSLFYFIPASCRACLSSTNASSMRHTNVAELGLPDPLLCASACQCWKTGTGVGSQKAGGGGNTSDLSGCSRSPVENRRPSHGSGGGMGLGGLSGAMDRDMERGGGMSTMLSHADRASTSSNMDRRGSTGGGGSTVGGSGGPLDRTSPTGSLASSHSQSQLTPSRQLSHAERLRKVLAELVETEASYVKHLNNLLENYLEPLRNASFLTSAEVTALFGNIREIVAFQRLFLQALREAIDIEPDFQKFDQPYEFKNVLVSIASAFLYYASQFKLYSSFCASHSKAQKVLHPSEGNQALQEFLASRNPRQQHSATLESYLIKPIQRILKYPLLLQQLKNLTEPGTDENRHLVEALMVMEKVAEHINEMQRIHEEYGAIFDHLFRQHQKACKQVESSKPVDLSLGDLLYYGGVEWLNISDFLGKIKKGLELHAMCFVFKTAVVFLCKERLRQKKKLMGGVSGKNNSAEVEIIRYQVLIPVTEVQVRASSMKDMDSHFLWELIHLKNQLQRRSEKVYHLSNSTSEFRNAFLKTIRQIIRESVRNMSIPNKGPASGKDGGGNGASGGGSGGSGGSRGGSIGSSGGGSNSSSRQMNTNTLQSTRSAGGRRKQQPQNQSATLQRHSTGVMDYGGNMESYDNVPETHHNGHVPQQQRLDMNGAAAGYRNRGKTGSDATDEQSDSTTKSDLAPPPPPPPPHHQQQHQQHHSSSSETHHAGHRPNNNNYQDRSDRSDRSSITERSVQERMGPGSGGGERYRNGRRSSSSGAGDRSHDRVSLGGGDNNSSRSSSRQRGASGRDSVPRSDMEEDDIISGAESRRRATLGRTPNHLSLSTSSTLSTASTGSQAKLIQASNTPGSYQSKSNSKPGSPVWKPRENFSNRGSSTSLATAPGGCSDRDPGSESMTLPRAGKTFNTFGRGEEHRYSEGKRSSGANISGSMSGSIGYNIGSAGHNKHQSHSLQGSTKTLHC
ncbi:Dbl (DH) domain [Trinorchestia longiramus]|nr:Dbl (DH) domain [Trinorchestia longiramus]